MQPSPTDTIERLRRGDERCLEELYCLYRNEFISWAYRQFNTGPDDAKDIFQNTLIAFYENISNGKLTALTCEVKTYLFAVARNQLLNLKKNSPALVNLDDPATINHIEDPANDSMVEEYQKALVQQALASMGTDCREILRLFYFNGYDLESIARDLDYKNENVVKVKKSQCLRKLADLFSRQPKQ